MELSTVVPIADSCKGWGSVLPTVMPIHVADSCEVAARAE